LERENTKPRTAAATRIWATCSLRRPEPGPPKDARAVGTMTMTADAWDAMTAAIVATKSPPSASSTTSAASAPIARAPSVAEMRSRPTSPMVRSPGSWGPPESREPTIQASLAFATPNPMETRIGRPAEKLEATPMTKIRAATAHRARRANSTASTAAPAAGHHAAVVEPAGVRNTAETPRR